MSIETETSTENARTRAKAPADDDLLSTKQAAHLLGISASTLHRWRCQGYGPAHVRVGKKLVRYIRRTLLDWIRRPHP